MLWQRQANTTFYDGPGAPIDFKAMVGWSGRVLFAENGFGQRMLSLACTIVKISRSDIVVELQNPAVLPPVESAVILEVVQQTSLIQCFTSIAARLGQSRVVLRTPGRPHVLQRRRFPRVDLFLGVTITLPGQTVGQSAAQMINLSLDGAALVLVEPVSPGTDIVVNMPATGLHPPEVNAEAVRCTPTPSRLWVAGVRFQSLLPEQELYLGKYVANLSDVNEH